MANSRKTMRQQTLLVSMRVKKNYQLEVVKRIKVTEKDSVRLKNIAGVQKIIPRSNSKKSWGKGGNPSKSTYLTRRLSRSKSKSNPRDKKRNNKAQNKQEMAQSSEKLVKITDYFSKFYQKFSTNSMSDFLKNNSYISYHYVSYASQVRIEPKSKLVEKTNFHNFSARDTEAPSEISVNIPESRKVLKQASGKYQTARSVSTKRRDGSIENSPQIRSKSI